jgi:hypothetical protein
VRERERESERGKEIRGEWGEGLSSPLKRRGGGASTTCAGAEHLGPSAPSPFRVCGAFPNGIPHGGPLGVSLI